MMQSNKWSRREALGSIVLPLIAGASAWADTSAAQQRASNTKVLVAYFSRTGNTRVIANQIRRARGADLFEIQPAASYPEDYEVTVKQADEERAAGYEPPLKDTIPNIAAYDTVFLGFPIWGTTAPAVVRSFLSKHDMSEKTLVPFVTHGGYGLGQSLAVVAAHAPRARLLKEFSMRADQERETLSQVTDWLRQTSVTN
jgi:flavodoxin